MDPDHVIPFLKAHIVVAFYRAYESHAGLWPKTTVVVRYGRRDGRLVYCYQEETRGTRRAKSGK